MKRWLPFHAASVVFALTSLANSSAGATLYYTNFSGRTINTLDTVSRATALVDTVPAGVGGNPDSLLFDSTGRIIYTIYNGAPGQVRIFDPSAHTDTLLATGFSSQLVDLILEPSLTTLLVSDRGNNTLDRINIGTGTVTPLGAIGSISTPDGLAYDASGNLFVAAASGIQRINSTTGAILQTGGIGLIDGLTYDSFSNKLWGASGSCVYNFDLTTLAASACISTASLGSGDDGIVSDGTGHLYIAASGNAVVLQYTITGGALAAVSNNLGSLDDMAPASGAGAPPSAPEPAAWSLTALGFAGLVAWRGRKQR